MGYNVQYTAYTEILVLCQKFISLLDNRKKQTFPYYTGLLSADLFPPRVWLLLLGSKFLHRRLDLF